MTTANPLQACPTHFKQLELDTKHVSKQSAEDLWTHLSQKKTFQDTQWFPYRVEFLNESKTEPLFKKGDYTNHHGPLLSANGMLSNMTSNTYRRLDYFYGSYVLSFRLFRPVSLEFWIDPEKKNCILRSKLTFYIHPKIPLWVQSIMKYTWTQTVKRLV